MKKVLIAVIGVFCLLVIFLFGSVVFLNSEWLKNKLSEKVKEVLDADLKVEAISFSPLIGEASLSGISLAREDSSVSLKASLESIKLNLSITGLVFREINIEYLEMIRPEFLTVLKDFSLSKEASAGKTGGLWKKIGKKETDEQDSKPLERKPVEFKIGKLVIQDGKLEYKFLGEEKDPFEFKLYDFDYSVSDVSLESVYRLYYGADIQCKMEAGSQVEICKKVVNNKSNCSIKGLSLSYISKLIGKNGGFQVDEGKMNIMYEFSEESPVKIDLAFFDLIVNSSEGSKGKKIMFIPLETIVEYINKKDGNVCLSFDMTPPKETGYLSEDLAYVVYEFVRGVEKALANMIAAKGKKLFADLGKKKVFDFLKGNDKSK